MEWIEVFIILIGGIVFESAAVTRIGPDENWVSDVNMGNRTNRQSSCPSCDSCGVRNVRRRIIGGQITKEYQFPWMAFVRSPTPEGMESCGGAIINSEYVLCAAHCIKSAASEMSVILRVHDLLVLSNDILIFCKVTKVIVHPGWDTKTFTHDIALLKLDRKLELNARGDPYALRPICLPGSERNYPAGEQAIAIGWGDTTGKGQTSTKLKEVTLPIIDHAECKKQFKTLTDNMLCAGNLSGLSTCQGDSGGPLMVVRDNVIEQCGIVSYGKKGCVNYSVFTDVSKYIKWIIDNIENTCVCTKP